MSETTTSPRLSARFQEALGYAAELHNTQTRKASQVPYVGHLLSVAGLVIEADGTETEAIAALLHDAAENQGGDATLDETKPPWDERKRNCIAHLHDASDSTIRVSPSERRQTSSR